MWWKRWRWYMKKHKKKMFGVRSEREKKSQNPQKVNIVHNFKYAWKIYAYYVKSWRQSSNQRRTKLCDVFREVREYLEPYHEPTTNLEVYRSFSILYLQDVLILVYGARDDDLSLLNSYVYFTYFYAHTQFQVHDDLVCFHILLHGNRFVQNILYLPNILYGISRLLLKSKKLEISNNTEAYIKDFILSQ